MEARPAPTGSRPPTSTCSRATAMSGSTTCKSSQGAGINSRRLVLRSNSAPCPLPPVPCPTGERSELHVIHVLPHHVPPVRPVVSALRAPVVEAVADAAARQDPREPVRLVGMLPRPGPGRDVDVATGEMMQRPRVGHVCHVVDRIIEVEIVVVIADHESFHVVHA